MDVYTNSGCHNNDQAADVAMSYIDNGMYTHCSGIIILIHKPVARNFYWEVLLVDLLAK